MKNYASLSHTRYDCKYHVVFIPKYRRKKIYGAIRRHLGEIFHELAKQKVLPPSSVGGCCVTRSCTIV